MAEPSMKPTLSPSRLHQPHQESPIMPTIHLKPALDFLLKHKVDDLTVRQLSVLIGCTQQERTVRDLATEMDVSKPAITRATNKLELRGFLKRRKDKNDRRSVLLTLTPAGRKFAANFA